MGQKGAFLKKSTWQKINLRLLLGYLSRTSRPSRVPCWAWRADYETRRQKPSRIDNMAARSRGLLVRATL